MTASLRLLSVDARPFGRDGAGLARAISAAGCDVVCVHGAPHLLRWRSMTSALARRAALVVVTGGRPAGGNLLLSTLGVDVVAVRDLRFAVRRPLAPAGAALAVLRSRGADFVFVSATLAGHAAQRLEQARLMKDAIGTLVPGDPPTVVSAEGDDRSLLGSGVAVADRLFVDDRIVVGPAVQRDHSIRVELSLESG